ncbi:MAG TPA: hypothetical protein VG937_35410 [Polyangiaceae bacterium]|nr:hypothetical protein [Polyangiaceae bacterium]
MRLEFSHEFFEQFARESKDNPDSAKTPDSAKNEAANELGKSLMSAESMAFDLGLGNPDIELSLQLNYLETGTSNLRPGRLGGAPRPIPPQFWQAYAIAPLTLVSTGVDDQAMTELESAWGGSLKAFFDQIHRSSGMTPELSERVTRASGDIPEHFRFTFSQPAFFPPRSSEPSKHGRAAKDTGPSWYLIGFAGSGERYKAGTDVLLEASKAKPSSSPTTRWVRIDKRPPNLPPESIVLRTDTPGKDPSFTLALPTPEWIWLLVASNQNELFSQARRLLPTLSKPAQPDPVAQAAFAPDPLLAMTVNLVALKNTLGDRLSNINFANLPARGTAPIFLRVTGQRQQRADHPTLSITLHSHWTPAAFADLLGLIKINQALTADEHPP